MDEFLNKTLKKYAVEIENNTDFPDKEKYQKITKKYHDDNFWFLLGGPLQTMLTGGIGFILLLVYRKRFITSEKIHFGGWTLIFISLFWLRQFANLFVGLLTYILKGQTSQRKDEARLANYLDLNIWTIEIITGIIALEILLIVLTWLPKKMVLTFMLSGIVGGILGYYLWLIKFGKYIMP
jgi:hypothetical protein